ncbi:hypothetical protein VTI28DRAFT_7390 [Corynascus sepedonium]
MKRSGHKSKTFVSASTTPLLFGRKTTICYNSTPNKVRPLDLPDALEHQSNDESRLSTVSLDNHVVNDVSVDRVSDDASVIADDVTLTSLTADDTSVSQATIKTANDICLN